MSGLARAWLLNLGWLPLGLAAIFALGSLAKSAPGVFMLVMVVGTFLYIYALGGIRPNWRPGTARKPPCRPRFTIRRIMMATVVAAILLAIARTVALATLADYARRGEYGSGPGVVATTLVFLTYLNLVMVGSMGFLAIHLFRIWWKGKPKGE